MVLGGLLIANPSSAAPSFHTVKDNQWVHGSHVLRTLVDQWLVVDLQNEDKAYLWDVSITAEQDQTRIVLGMSSEFIFAAVLKGQANCEAGVLESGDVLLLRHLGTTPPGKNVFAAREFAQTLRDAGRSDLATDLDRTIKVQKQKRFWGVLRPTNLNVGSPMNDDVEALRQSYTTPTLVRLKRSVDDIHELPELVAFTFLQAANANNAETIAALLDPTPFRSSAKEGRLEEDRRAIATRVLEQNWASGIALGSIKATPDPMRFVFLAGNKPYQIHLTVFDGGVFVQRIEPITAATPTP
ncbi:hypothetical protein [Algisphaera agarilytica]|uniref:hypothetical protein n=1 Tax=Algisphaera agarilytica TaxID=1385975 RepID=UPI001C88DD8B|nr:hypothetical protein [Algisphaera agarilytica]